MGLARLGFAVVIALFAASQAQSRVAHPCAVGSCKGGAVDLRFWRIGRTLNFRRAGGAHRRCESGVRVPPLTGHNPGLTGHF